MTVDGPMNRKFTKQIENLKLLTKRRNEQKKSSDSSSNTSSRPIGDTGVNGTLCRISEVNVQDFNEETGGGDNECSTGLLKINNSYFKIDVLENPELSKEEESNQLEEYFKMPGYKK